MTLNEDQKTWIVTQWAMMRPSAEIRAEFEQLFGAPLTAKQAHNYNPCGSRGRDKTMTKWKMLHTHIRHKFLTELAEIPIANAAVRLFRLEQMCVASMQKGEVELAADIIEQAAKEVGGLFTNKREIEAETRSTHTHNVEFGTEEARAKLGDILASAITAAQGGGSTKH